MFIIRKKQDIFEKDCKKFEELIKEGRKLLKNAPSIRGFNLDKVYKSENKGFKWFIETRNFLASIFGEGFRDVITFRKCFRKYSSINMMGQYSGEHVFIKEDISKAIGVLEGTYMSFKLNVIKRRSKVIVVLSKIYQEIKEWISMIFGRFKNAN